MHVCTIREISDVKDPMKVCRKSCLLGKGIKAIVRNVNCEACVVAEHLMSLQIDPFPQPYIKSVA